MRVPSSTPISRERAYRILNKLLTLQACCFCVVALQDDYSVETRWLGPNSWFRLDCVVFCCAVAERDGGEFESMKNVEAGEGEVGGGLSGLAIGERTSELHVVDVVVECLGKTGCVVLFDNGGDGLLLD